MNRSLVYLVAVLLVVGLLYIVSGEEAPVASQLTRQQILTEFSDLSNHRLPVAPVLGGEFFTNSIMFPASFTGQAEDQFLVVIEDGHVLYTLEYVLVEKGSAKARVVEYQLTDYQEGLLHPAVDYEEWQWNGSKFIKAAPEPEHERFLAPSTQISPPGTEPQK